MNWRGRPLTSHEVIVQTIAATTTRTGLTVHAEQGLHRAPSSRAGPAMRSSPPCADQQLIGDNRILLTVTPAKSPIEWAVGSVL